MAHTRKWLLVAAGSLLLLAGAWIALHELPAMGTPDGIALNRSLAGHEDASTAGACRSLRPEVWRCDISTNGGSSSFPWWLRTDGRCWTASLSPDLSPPQTRGCVKLIDQLF